MESLQNEYKASMDTDLSESDQKKWSETTQNVLELIKQNPEVSRKELCDNLHINTSAVQKHIKKLKSQHIIERSGGAKGGKWNVLDENGYPPVPRNEVYNEVFEQAEIFKKYAE